MLYQTDTASRFGSTQVLARKSGLHCPVISRLPKWVWSGAWGLSFVAGTVNIVGLLSLDRHAITHLTGNTSLLAQAVAGLQLGVALHLAALIAAFVAGCILSGFLIQDGTLKLGRRYGVALFIESAFLFASVPLMQRGSVFGTYAAACACGLQNAMASTFSGAVVRTTHVSGMFTDLGISIGHVLRGMPVDHARLKLCMVVILGFFFGGVVGALAFQAFAFLAVLIPASLTAVAAASYGLYRILGGRGKST